MHMNQSPATEAGLLLSLTHALPDPDCALARRARRLARQLATHPRDRALAREAANLTADLLSAADAGVLYAEDGCLDEEFDA